MTWHPAKKTTLTGEEAAALFLAVVPQVLGFTPGARQLACIVGQSAGETGNWTSMFGWNFGNSKVSALKPLEQQDYQNLRISEILNGQEVYFAPEGELSGKGGTVVGTVYPVPPGHPQTRFRWFPTPEAGARHWCELLTWPRYARSLQALKTGDPAAFAQALKSDGYYTASLSLYTKLLVERFNKYLPACEAATEKRPMGKLSAGLWEFKTGRDASEIMAIEDGAIDVPGALVREADPDGVSVRWEMQLDEDWTPPDAYRARMRGLRRLDGMGWGALMVGGLVVAGAAWWLKGRK